MNAPATFEGPFIGIGSYTAPEAARLLRTSARNVRRWLGGYDYQEHGEAFHSPPLWIPELPRFDEHHLELGFRDLVELRFIKAFIEAGLGLKTIRNCLELAREVVKDERPFSTRKFQTDGASIFLESVGRSGETKLLDLRKGQYAIKPMIERTFKDLDIEDEAVARWRPFGGKPSIVIDPDRRFGQPIAADFGVPTIALADAVEAEGSVERAARLFEVPPSVVRDAVRFEASLSA